MSYYCIFFPPMSSSETFFYYSEFWVCTSREWIPCKNRSLSLFSDGAGLYIRKTIDSLMHMSHLLWMEKEVDDVYKHKNSILKCTRSTLEEIWTPEPERGKCRAKSETGSLCFCLESVSVFIKKLVCFGFERTWLSAILTHRFNVVKDTGLKINTIPYIIDQTLCLSSVKMLLNSCLSEILCISQAKESPWGGLKYTVL